MSGRKRVVVTGYGAVTSLGVTGLAATAALTFAVLLALAFFLDMVQQSSARGTSCISCRCRSSRDRCARSCPRARVPARQRPRRVPTATARWGPADRRPAVESGREAP